MADIISTTFPVKTFATENGCSSEQVIQVINALVVGPLTNTGFTQADRWIERSQRNDKNGRTDRASVSISPVTRREVWQDEFGNYVSVEEEDGKDIKDGWRINEERRLQRLRGDMNLFLDKGGY